ncbi:hypothetical protein [Streptacidiphilus sp. PAMC 29251]
MNVYGGRSVHVRPATSSGPHEVEVDVYEEAPPRVVATVAVTTWWDVVVVERSFSVQSGRRQVDDAVKPLLNAKSAKSTWPPDAETATDEDGEEDEEQTEDQEAQSGAVTKPTNE